MHIRVIASVLLSCLGMALVHGCMQPFDDEDSPSGHALTATSNTFGALVYQVVRAYVSHSDTCTSERLSMLAGHRTEIVQAIDAMITPSMVSNQLPDTLGASLFPLVDDGSLAALTHQLGTAVAAMVDPTFDPQQNTINALVHSMNGPSTFNTEHVYSLLRAWLNTVDAKVWLHHIAQLAQTPVGNTHVVAAFIDVGRNQLARFVQPIACAANVDSDADSDAETHTDAAPLASILLRDTPLSRPGGPVLATTLPAPYVMHATEAERTTRTITANAQHTPFAYALEMFADASRAGIPYDAFALLSDAMPAPVPCGNAIVGCQTYPIDNNPFADLAYLGFELMRYPRIEPLLRTLQQLVRDNPFLTERLLIAMGQTLHAAEQSHVAWTDPALLGMLRAMMPMISQMFAVPNNGAASTPERMMEVIHDLGRTARDLPEQISDIIGYTSLAKDPMCSDAKINRAQSIGVDYTQPRWIPQGARAARDNRSVAEQLIALMVSANCGRVPFTQKTVTEFLIHTIADKQPSNVCSAIDMLFDALSILPIISDPMGQAALDVIGCDGDVVWENLHALDQLARSGALDAFLPLARVFDDHDQVRTLLAMFTIIQDDLLRDDDTDAETRSGVRQLLPIAKQLLDAGVADSLFDMDALLVTILNADRTATMANDIVRVVDFALNQQHPVKTRRGTIHGTSLALEAVKSLQQIAVRLHNTGSSPAVPTTLLPGDNTRADGHAAALHRIIAYASTMLTHTYTDARDTTMPEDDVQRLWDRRVVPVMQASLDVAAHVFPHDVARQQCVIGALQTRVNAFLTGPDAVRAVQVFQAFAHHAGRDAITDIALHTLAAAEAAETHAPLHRDFLQVGAEALQTPLSKEDIFAFAAYVAHVLDPAQLASTDIVATLDQMLWRDPHDTLLTIARNSLTPHTFLAATPPLQIVLEAMTDVMRIRADRTCHDDAESRWSSAQLAGSMHSITAFLQDDVRGLGSIYRLLSLRTQR